MGDVQLGRLDRTADNDTKSGGPKATKGTVLVSAYGGYGDDDACVKSRGEAAVSKWHSVTIGNMSSAFECCKRNQI